MLEFLSIFWAFLFYVLNFNQEITLKAVISDEIILIESVEYDRFAENNSDIVFKSGSYCHEPVLSFGEKPDSMIFYEDSMLGISFNIPFNGDWGGNVYNVPPFQRSDDELLFGPVVHVGGPCNMVGNLSMTWKDPIDFEVLVDNSFAYLGFDLMDPEILWSKMDFEDKEVVKINPASFCDRHDYLVFGEKYNYYFRNPGCTVVLTDELIESVKLL